MVLKKREKILALAVGGLLVLAVAYWIWPAQGGSLADLREKRDELAEDLINKKNRAQRAKKAAERLTQWQSRALPAAPETARSLYQNWLRELVDRVAFRNTKINAMEGQSRRGVYTLLAFDVQCQGSLEQLTRFLYEFYGADHMHKIRSLNIKPLENTRELDLTIVVEAMSLPGSTQKDKLSTEPGKRLKLASLEDYKKTIVDRNLFAVYAPPKQAKEKTEDKPMVSGTDPSRSAFLTAIVETDGIPEAWLYVRTTGENFIL